MNGIKFVYFIVSLSVCSLSYANCPPIASLTQHEDGHWTASNGWTSIIVPVPYRDAVSINSSKIASFYSVTISPKAIDCSYLTDGDEVITISLKLKQVQATPKNLPNWYPTNNDELHWACMADGYEKSTSICPYEIR